MLLKATPRFVSTPFNAASAFSQSAALPTNSPAFLGSCSESSIRYSLNPKVFNMASAKSRQASISLTICSGVQKMCASSCGKAAHA